MRLRVKSGKAIAVPSGRFRKDYLAGEEFEAPSNDWGKLQIQLGSCEEVVGKSAAQKQEEADAKAAKKEEADKAKAEKAAKAKAAKEAKAAKAKAAKEAKAKKAKK